MSECSGFNCTCPPGQTNIPFGFCTTVFAAAIASLVIVIIVAICICIFCMMETIRNICNPCRRANVFPMPTGSNSTRTQTNTPAEDKPVGPDNPPSDVNTGESAAENEVERLDDGVEEIGPYQEPEAHDTQEPEDEEEKEPEADAEGEETAVENEINEDTTNENDDQDR